MPAPTKKDLTPTKKDLEKDEKEIGRNIPEAMKGLDTEDVGEERGE